MFRRGKKENKVKLEHKLYLARENPEPIFDISDCNVHTVPSGIYSLCRVFLKEHLNLSSNNLSSLSGGGNLKDLNLLRTLCLSHNVFTNLPDEIQLLINLKELYVDNNQLKKLPSSICNLANLIILNVSSNNLVELPQNMGQLGKLRKLDISGNRRLANLPKQMGTNRKLVELILDSENFVYPPPHIAAQSTEIIIKFLCDDNNYEYIPNIGDDVDSEANNDNEVGDSLYANLEAKIWKLDQIKEQKIQEFLTIEKHNELVNRQEVELATSLRFNKEKLLADIQQHQNKLDESLDKIQQLKDLERMKLIKQLHEVELNADIAIQQLLEMNKEPSMQLLEQEQIEQDRLLAAANKYNENLCKTEILSAMEELLKNETIKFKQFHDFRCETSKSILEQEMQTDSHLLELLQDQGNKTKELSKKLLEDNELQKVAVATLLEKSDARSWSLVQQVKLVESQLAALTIIEMDRRKLEVDHQLNDLSEKRINLSTLLMDLLEQQGLRRSELLSTLQSLEEHKCADDFWFIQYQQLLDRMPEGIVEFQKNLNPALIECLLITGALNYLPFLAKWSQSEDKLLAIGDEDLIDVGIKKCADRKCILRAFSIYKSQRTNLKVTEPTAPFNMEEASAPPMEATQSYATPECVICLDHVCEIIYVPCGHLCCCTNCSGPINDCPMCRANIQTKIRVDST